MSQTIAGAPRSSWADDWDPAPPHPRPAATARTVAAGAPSSAGEAAAPATSHRHASPRRAAATPPAAATPSPAPTPPAAATPAHTTTPGALVAAYYAALDAHRFADAWAVPAPAVRRAFGGFAHWRAGYATTLSSRPRQLQVTPSGPATWEVRHVLVARDRASCGAALERRFAVRWRVARAAGGWSVTALGATPLTRARACS